MMVMMVPHLRLRMIFLLNSTAWQPWQCWIPKGYILMRAIVLVDKQPPRMLLMNNHMLNHAKKNHVRASLPIVLDNVLDNPI
jgi:hypothetical protein